jgi:hypothetical protein
MDEWADAIDAHLSAQAKVQTNDSKAVASLMQKAYSLVPENLSHIERMRWMGEYVAARLSQGTQGNAPDAASFVCYLIDKHEKDVIYEESLHGWFADFLKDPRYSQGAQSSGNSGEVAQGEAALPEPPDGE